EQRTRPPKMGSPPVMVVLNAPGTDCIRAAPPSVFTAAWTWANPAPVTVLSTETTTWLDAGSTAHDVPDTVIERSMLALAALSWAALRVTSFGTAPPA